MQNQVNATAGATSGGGNVDTREPSALIDVQSVAELLNCSTRHVYRLANRGHIPRPVKLGALVRWNRAVIESWIAEGCPFCREVVRNG